MTLLSTSSILTRLKPSLRWRRRDEDEEDVGTVGKKPWLLEYRSAEIFIILVVCVAVFTVCMERFRCYYF